MTEARELKRATRVGRSIVEEVGEEEAKREARILTASVVVAVRRGCETRRRDEPGPLRAGKASRTGAASPTIASRAFVQSCREMMIEVTSASDCGIEPSADAAHTQMQRLTSSPILCTLLERVIPMPVSFEIGRAHV